MTSSTKDSSFQPRLHPNCFGVYSGWLLIIPQNHYDKLHTLWSHKGMQIFTSYYVLQSKMATVDQSTISDDFLVLTIRGISTKWQEMLLYQQLFSYSTKNRQVEPLTFLIQRQLDSQVPLKTVLNTEFRIGVRQEPRMRLPTEHSFTKKVFVFFIPHSL